MRLNELRMQWHRTFGSADPDVIVRSPGRVNIIGEHTDYNAGWVMPGAMDRSLYILMRRIQGEGKVMNHWVAADLDEELRFEHQEEIPATNSIWAKYILGAIHIYENDLGPLDILIGGNLPIGAGVSSSSSLVGGLLLAFQKLTGDTRSRTELAQLSSRVEREIIGLQGGIMDQFAILLSHRDQVMLLDCRDRSYEFIPGAIPGAAWILLNTRVKHQLIDSDYNQRAAQCKQAVEKIKLRFKDVESLRDVSPDMLDEARLPELLHRRACFVIEENARVLQMKMALEKGDAPMAGKLLTSSHHGLQFQYEVSCAELDHLAGLANATERVFGGRMMGGGFGGCVICLVQQDAVEPFVKQASASYRNRFGFEPESIRFSLSAGAEIIH